MSKGMNAVSLHKDEAAAIRDGRQTLRATSWETWHRGPLLVVAAERMPFGDGHKGTTCCVVDVVGVRDMTPADERAAGCKFASHRVVWELANPRPVDPRPVTGMRLLYGLDAAFRTVPAYGAPVDPEPSRPEPPPFETVYAAPRDGPMGMGDAVAELAARGTPPDDFIGQLAALTGAKRVKPSVPGLPDTPRGARKRAAEPEGGGLFG